MLSLAANSVTGTALRGARRGVNGSLSNLKLLPHPCLKLIVHEARLLGRRHLAVLGVALHEHGRLAPASRHVHSRPIARPFTRHSPVEALVTLRHLREYTGFDGAKAVARPGVLLGRALAPRHCAEGLEDGDPDRLQRPLHLDLLLLVEDARLLGLQRGGRVPSQVHVSIPVLAEIDARLASDGGGFCPVLAFRQALLHQRAQLRLALSQQLPSEAVQGHADQQAPGVPLDVRG
mmetsp:Transcript_26166/g.62392  ORF Transcript_26166/g.62392 Transcript_26166/m.62392 type:complete len:234 (-) Transcript_26166:1291-1992(-)